MTTLVAVITLVAAAATLAWFLTREGETLADAYAAPDGAVFRLAFVTKGRMPHVLRVDLVWSTDAATNGDPDVPPIDFEVELTPAESYRTAARPLLAATFTSRPDQRGHAMERLADSYRARETHVVATLPALDE
ncbi:MAG: hypothetical protein JNK04_06930, partial [Myxococcales bacterium]|nr:hypothetical protein [Myxococcales bacterium]